MGRLQAGEGQGQLWVQKDASGTLQEKERGGEGRRKAGVRVQAREDEV